MPVDHERTRSLFQNVATLAGKLKARPAPERVHHFRTTARRIEALLQVVRPEPDKATQKFLKQMARIRRRCGRVRDVDVQVAALRKLKIGREATTKAQLMDTLDRKHERRCERLLEELDTATVRRFQKSAARVCTSLFEPPPAPKDAEEGEAAAPAPPPMDAIQPVPLALRMFSHLARTHRALTEETLHQYRLQGKYVRYVAEMAGEEDAQAVEIVAEMKRMQDAVGEWHDWLELMQTAERVLAHPERHALYAAIGSAKHGKFLEARNVCAHVRRRLLEMWKEVQERSKAPAAREESDEALTVSA